MGKAVCKQDFVDSKAQGGKVAKYSSKSIKTSHMRKTLEHFVLSKHTSAMSTYAGCISMRYISCICSGNCVNPCFKYRFYLFLHAGFIEFLVSLMSSVYLIITLLHQCLHYPSGCKQLPIKRVISSPFFYLNDDATLAHSHFGEGAYAIMIIIIKMILMCLVFATQLLIMA